MPVGVIGANYEARPNVTVDVASQLVKSRNAGVLRTGAAALGSAAALLDEVIAPALAAGRPGPAAPSSSSARPAARRRPRAGRPAGPDPAGDPARQRATTAALAAEAAAHGVRTLAHADGGGVLYVDAARRPAAALALVERSLDRLGVCNRLNLLLVDRAAWDELLPAGRRAAAGAGCGIAPSLPPHAHPLGHEWALDDGREATVTVAAAADGRPTRRGSPNEETSGLAAAHRHRGRPAAAAFLDAYAGTGAFWNATTRLLDGFKLLGAPGDRHQRGPRARPARAR